MPSVSDYHSNPRHKSNTTLAVKAFLLCVLVFVATSSCGCRMFGRAREGTTAEEPRTKLRGNTDPTGLPSCSDYFTNSTVLQPCQYIIMEPSIKNGKVVRQEQIKRCNEGSYYVVEVVEDDLEGSLRECLPPCSERARSCRGDLQSTNEKLPPCPLPTNENEGHIAQRCKVGDFGKRQACNPGDTLIRSDGKLTCRKAVNIWGGKFPGRTCDHHS